jgi:perosamine synthetase
MATFATLKINSSEADAVVDCLIQGQYGSFSHSVPFFEAKISEHVGGLRVISVSSGTIGLIAALASQGVGTGDYVAVPAITFVATAQAVLALGAVPVVVDVENENGLISESSFEEVLSQWSVKALVPVHLFGNPSSVSVFRWQTLPKDVCIIEDAAQAFGTDLEYSERFSRERIMVFSFQINKQLGLGHGGCVACSDPVVERKVRSYKNNGIQLIDGRIVVTGVGINGSISGVSAVLGLAVMERFNKILEDRKRTYRILEDVVENVGSPLQKYAMELDTVSPSRFVMRVNDEIVISRLLERSRQLGLPLEPMYTPLHLLPGLRGRLRFTSTIESEQFSQTTLMLHFPSPCPEEFVDSFERVVKQVCL